MAESQTAFRDFDHVRAWLQQFDKPSVAQCRDWATVDMLAMLGQAVRVVAEEVAALKGARAGEAGPKGAEARIADDSGRIGAMP